MRLLLLSILLSSTMVMAEDFMWESDWGIVAATCPNDGFAGKLRVDFTAKVDEYNASVAKGECIAYVVVDDAQDSEGGWIYDADNFKAMVIAMDQYDEDYFAITGERIGVTLEVHRSVEYGYLVYNQREAELKEQLAHYRDVKDDLTAKLESALGELDAMTALRDRALGERDSALGELDRALGERDSALGELDRALGDRDKWHSKFVSKNRESNAWYHAFADEAAINRANEAKIGNLYTTIDKQACIIDAWETFGEGGHNANGMLHKRLAECNKM